MYIVAGGIYSVTFTVLCDIPSDLCARVYVCVCGVLQGDLLQVAFQALTTSPRQIIWLLFLMLVNASSVKF